MSNEFDSAQTLRLGITPIGTTKRHHQTFQQQFANFGHFGVDNGHFGSVHWRERLRRLLRFHQRFTKETAPAHQILLKQLGHDLLNIRHTHFVDQTVDRLFQRVPTQPTNNNMLQ